MSFVASVSRHDQMLQCHSPSLVRIHSFTCGHFGRLVQSMNDKRGGRRSIHLNTHLGTSAAFCHPRPSNARSSGQPVACPFVPAQDFRPFLDHPRKPKVSHDSSNCRETHFSTGPQSSSPGPHATNRDNQQPSVPLSHLMFILGRGKEDPLDIPQTIEISPAPLFTSLFTLPGATEVAT